MICVGGNMWWLIWASHLFDVLICRPRRLPSRRKIPVLPGSPGLKSVQEATAFLQARDLTRLHFVEYMSLYILWLSPFGNHLDQYGLFVFVSYPNDFWLDPNWLKNDCDVWLKDNNIWCFFEVCGANHISSRWNVNDFVVFHLDDLKAGESNEGSHCSWKQLSEEVVVGKRWSQMRHARDFTCKDWI